MSVWLNAHKEDSVYINHDSWEGFWMENIDIISIGNVI